MTTTNRNRSVTVGDHFNEFADKLVEDGQYGSFSDVVRSGLRLLEKHESEVALAKLLRKSLDSGDCGQSIDEILSEIYSEYDAKKAHSDKGREKAA